jgi:LPXTG-site transpeptidase (sortase) family protein
MGCDVVQKKEIILPVFFIILSLSLIIIATIGINKNKASEDTELGETAEQTTPEPELLETVETPVIIENWQPMRLIIPAIPLDLMCVGDGDLYDIEFLRQGPAHFQMSDLPSTEKGNVAFAGMWQFFENIDVLEEGDEIYLEVDGYRFIYEIVWKEVVDKHDWGAIDTTDYPSITLQTSYPIDYSAPNPDYRLNVRGELREVVKVPGN